MLTSPLTPASSYTPPSTKGISVLSATGALTENSARITNKCSHPSVVAYTGTPALRRQGRFESEASLSYVRLGRKLSPPDLTTVEGNNLIARHGDTHF